MIEIVLRIYNKCIKIKNNVDEFDEKIKLLSSAFEFTETKKCDSLLLINKNRILIKTRNGNIKYNMSLNIRDLFNVFYLCIYQTFTQQDMAFIHSAVVSKNNQALLILGNFGSGKTTLANEFVDKGYKLISADQTLIKIENNNLLFCCGSSKNVFNKKLTYLQNSQTLNSIQITKIIQVVGLCNEGKPLQTKVNDEIIKLKRLWQYIIWPYVQPLINNTNKTKIIIPKSYYSFVKSITNLPIDFVELRGDPNELTKLL